eukprot:gene10629-12411_t
MLWMLYVSVLVLGLFGSSVVWEVKAKAAEEPRRALRHRLVEDVQEIHERFGGLLDASTEVLADNVSAFAEANIHLRNDEETKILTTKSKIWANAHQELGGNKLDEMHKQFEEPIFSLPFSILPNAAIEGWADLDNNLPPILSGISFPFVDEDIHRYNHIGNLDHNDHSTAITSTYPTSTEPDAGMHVTEHAEMAPKCTPLSWMHHQKAEASPKEEASPKCMPLSWMHAKDQPSEKAHVVHAQVLDLLPPFSLPLSLPLPLNEHFEAEAFQSTLVAMHEQHVSEAEPEMMGPDCDCIPGFGRDCCHIPPFACNPGKIDCKIPWYLPLPPVCGCDGRTYANFCEALFENCVKCWEPGPCPMSYY